MFWLTQHFRDAVLFKSFCDTLDCGVYYQRTNREQGNYTVAKFSDLDTKVLAFFRNHPVIEVKYKDYLYFL